MTPVQYARTWLLENCSAMPREIPNFLCWRVVARRLYKAYERSASQAKKGTINEAPFVTLVLATFPKVALSDWRFVDGEWEKEFEFMKCTTLLSPAPKRRPESFSQALQKKFEKKWLA